MCIDLYIYACMYVCMYVRMYACMYVCKHNVCICIYICIYVYVCTYACMHACMYVYAGKYMYLGLRKLYVFVCVRVLLFRKGVGHHDQGSVSVESQS